jgi:two-component system CheB/CheR fusion protein
MNATPVSDPTAVEQLRRANASLAEENQKLREQLGRARARRSSAERELEQERDFVSAILESTNALIVVTDPDGRIVRFNRAAERVSGLDAQQVLGKSVTQIGLIPEQDLSGVSSTLHAVLEGGQLQPHENRWRHRDGSERTVEWINVPLLDEQGNPAFVLGSGIDITRRIEAQMRERDQLAEIAQLHRAHTAGELAAVLAHEINQPLAAITSYSSAGILGSGAGEDIVTRNVQLFEKIADAAVRAGRVVRDLRAFVSRAPVQVGPIEFSEPLNVCVDLLEPYARRFGVQIEIDRSYLPRIVADPIQVQHILVNLVRNGIEAIIGAGQQHGSVRISVDRHEDMARITIQDTGPGIGEEDLAQLYQPFYSSKHEGLGMGFRISRTLAAANGGRIVAETNAPGAIFRVLLRLAT